jgi:hypothetical protein
MAQAPYENEIEQAREESFQKYSDNSGIETTPENQYGDIDRIREEEFKNYSEEGGIEFSPDDQYEAEINQAREESFKKFSGDSPTSAGKISVDDNSSKTFKVQLSCGSQTVIFEASVPVSESRNVNYDSYGVIHLPTDIWAYRNTSSRRFSMSGNLVSRTPSEASQNAKNIDLIRSWALPDFGGTGATPPILRLTAYGNNNINNVKVLLSSYSIQFPDTVDYIFTGTVPMPVIMNVTIELVEAYSPLEVTAKKWKINVSKGGSFVYGVGAMPIGNGKVGDPIMNIASSKDPFSGIASLKMIGSKNLSNGNTLEEFEGGGSIEFTPDDIYENQNTVENFEGGGSIEFTPEGIYENENNNSKLLGIKDNTSLMEKGFNSAKDMFSKVGSGIGEVTNGIGNSMGGIAGGISGSLGKIGEQLKQNANSGSQYKFDSEEERMYRGK